VAKNYRDTSIEDCIALLQSPWHESRLLALLLMVDRFKRESEEERRRLYHLYLEQSSQINNWDLVDSSAEHIVGGWLMQRSREPLHKLAASENLWQRRISIIATFHFIKQGAFDETLKLAEQLLADDHDLIHKAVGWMLREVGKRDRAVEEQFLRLHLQKMPRTTLRYAIEHFPEPLRQRYLKSTIQ